MHQGVPYYNQDQALQGMGILGFTSEMTRRNVVTYLILILHARWVTSTRYAGAVHECPKSPLKPWNKETYFQASIDAGHGSA